MDAPSLRAPVSRDDDLIATTATEIVSRLRSGDITPQNCLDALEQRIAAVDGPINALPTLCFERARAHADALMRKPAGERGLLAGLPVAIKDLSRVAGVRTTFGSPIFADLVPDTSDITVTQIEREGGIVYAKSNVPEFGAGGNTFNPIFGPTRNPWDLSRSAAGSSGGAAAALASGTAWLAHGSDLGGSLRNPASFCGIVGMRPTPGRCAASHVTQIDQTLGVQGPMARNVADVALFLDAMSGEHHGDVLSKPRPATSFARAAVSGWKPKRVAYSQGLGITPVDPQVAAITRAAAQALAKEGVTVEEAHPDMSGAHECFHVLRAHGFAIAHGPIIEQHRKHSKPDLLWNIEAGLKLSADEVVRAHRTRAKLARNLDEFLQRYDLLLTPATITAAFPVEQTYLAECDGQQFGNYVLWLAIAYAITLCGAPAISIPCGFTSNKLPVGLQVVARTNDDARALAGAAFIERILGVMPKAPIEPGNGQRRYAGRTKA